MTVDAPATVVKENSPWQHSPNASDFIRGRVHIMRLFIMVVSSTVLSVLEEKIRSPSSVAVLTPSVEFECLYGVRVLTQSSSACTGSSSTTTCTAFECLHGI